MINVLVSSTTDNRLIFSVHEDNFTPTHQVPRLFDRYAKAVEDLALCESSEASDNHSGFIIPVVALSSPAGNMYLSLHDAVPYLSQQATDIQSNDLSYIMTKLDVVIYYVVISFQRLEGFCNQKNGSTIRLSTVADGFDLLGNFVEKTATFHIYCDTTNDGIPRLLDAYRIRLDDIHENEASTILMSPLLRDPVFAAIAAPLK